MKYFIFGLLVLLTIAHQDYWWRTDHTTLVFGYLPVSLAYHISISIMASVFWGLACYYCWPKRLEVEDHEAGQHSSRSAGGR